MAKQAGDFFIEGTIDDLTFYKMEGKYYLRMKSSLTGKKFWKSKSFEGSRKSCKRFAEGNKLASKLYRMIEKEKRVYKLFCFLKKRAILLLKEGNSLIEAEELLMDYLMEFRFIEREKQFVINKREVFRMQTNKENKKRDKQLLVFCFKNKSRFNGNRLYKFLFMQTIFLYLSIEVISLQNPHQFRFLYAD